MLRKFFLGKLSERMVSATLWSMSRDGRSRIGQQIGDGAWTDAHLAISSRMFWAPAPDAA